MEFWLTYTCTYMYPLGVEICYFVLFRVYIPKSCAYHMSSFFDPETCHFTLPTERGIKLVVSLYIDAKVFRLSITN